MLTVWRTVVLLGMVLLCGVSYSKEHPNTKAAESGQNSEAEQRGSDSNPLTIKILPSQDAESNAAREEQYKKEKVVQDQKLVDATEELRNSTESLVRVTAILAFFTALLWVATFIQARVTKKTADQQAKDMQVSLGIAKQSADAASATARTLVSSQRPYIYVVKVSHVEHEILDSYTQYTIVNYGELPAIIEKLQVGISTSQGAEPDDPPISATFDHSVVSSSVFLPSEDRELREFPPGGISVTRETREVFFQVIIRYNGPITTGHESAFCWRFDKTSKNFVPFGGDKYSYTK
ncbi:hypothetical protein ACYX34_01600 [Nitrospira sp. CMX1]